MADIGELAQVAREDMQYCVDDLCPVIMEMLQDSSSLAKREVALWTFGQIVENTGWVMWVWSSGCGLEHIGVVLNSTECAHNGGSYSQGFLQEVMESLPAESLSLGGSGT